MGLLGEIYSFGNRTRNKLRGLLDDPKGYLQQTADQTANTLRDMTGANETAQQFALRDKINAGDKNALEQYRNLEKTIQNKLFDVALNFNPAAVGMFIGKGAKTWDAAAAAEAEKRLAAGDDARKVWSELGVFRGPDGHLRQEISDHKAEFSPVPAFFTNETGVRQGNVLKHPDLYGTDYGLENIMVKRGNEPGGSFLGTTINNELAPYASEIEIGTSGVKKTPLGFMVNPDQAKSINTHELQHAIQQREGWARGGSPEQFKTDADTLQAYWDALTRAQYGFMDAKKAGGIHPETGLSVQMYKDNMNGLSAKIDELRKTGAGLAPEEGYKRLAGEAEARATQARMNMDMAQRRATFPLDSYDVPVNQLIIRGGLLP